MEGAMFYWICWSFWVYLTFILDKKHSYRLMLSVMILLLIIVSNGHFVLGNYELYTGGLCLLLFSYAFISQLKRGAIIYIFICSFIISIAYVTFHLFEIFDPIWIIFKKEWMMGICFTTLAIVLQRTLKGRLLIVTTGTMQGEFFYAYFLNQYKFSYPIGAFSYLDVCALLAALLVGWSFFENLGTILQNHYHFFEKGKQKSS